MWGVAGTAVCAAADGLDRSKTHHNEAKRDPYPCWPGETSIAV